MDQDEGRRDGDALTREHAAALADLRAAWGRMDGHAVLVTGATSGIGLQTAVDLARLGADVLVHGRDAGRGAAALAAVQAASAPSAAPALYLADLSTLAGVHDLAARVRDGVAGGADGRRAVAGVRGAVPADQGAAGDRRDGSRAGLAVLLANAGVFCEERVVTADGLELTFAVNVAAPVLLAAQLLPALREAAPARIVVVSSASLWTGEIHWGDLQLADPGAWDPLVAYDQSKLAVAMLTLELTRRLRGSAAAAGGRSGTSRPAGIDPAAAGPAAAPDAPGPAPAVTAVCLDPGDVATTMLARGWPELPGIPVESGAVTSVYLASAPQAEGLSGAYLEGGRQTALPPAALDPRAGARLWQELERICGPLHV